LRRRIVLLVVLLSLLLAFLVIFLNLTETDVFLRRLLRVVVPQNVQDVVRPLRAPMVIGFSPEWEASDVPLRSPVTITFLTPMSASATESQVTIEPAVAGEFSWRGSTLVFTPREDWPMESEIAVSVNRDARSWLLRRMERGFTFRFTTLGPPAIVNTEPSQDVEYVYLRDRLTIAFNREMDHESVERRLSINPEISGRELAWSDNELIISGVLNPATEYRVVVGSGASDAAHGMRIEEDFEWIFLTTERPPYLALTEVKREALLTAEEPATLNLSLVNVSRVDVDLYSLDVPTYVTVTHSPGEEWRQFVPDHAPLLSWSVDPKVTLDRDEKRPLEIEGLEPGLYFLAARSPEGAEDRQILVSTRTALTLKRAAGQALVWATSLEDGEPAEGLEVTLYGDSNEALASGQTDESGVFAANLPYPSRGVHAVAEGVEDVSLCSDGWYEGIEPWRFGDVKWSWESQAEAYRVFLYSDRPVYRPGETVNYRAILRLDDDGAYTLPQIDTKVRVTASNYQGDVIYDADLDSNPFGTVHGAFVLGEELEPGEYLLRLTLGGEEHRSAFRILENERKGFVVEVGVDRQEYLAGDVIQATVSAEYNFGVPVAGATVEYTVSGRDYAAPWVEGDVSQGVCDGFPCGQYAQEIAAGNGITNEEGEFQLNLRADAARQNISQVLSLEATVSDAGGEQVTARASVLVHKGEFNIFLLPDHKVISSGEQANVALRTLDHQGRPLRDLDLYYTLQVIEWQQVPRTLQEGTYWEWQELVSEVKRSTVTTDYQGQATISFVPGQGGLYRLEVWGRDRGGYRVLAAAELWASDPDRQVGWRFSRSDRLELIPDKESYAPDEIARVLIQSPYERAVGLVTIERGGILSHFVAEFRDSSPLLELPLEASYAPNVYVSVVLVPRGGHPDQRTSFKVGYAELGVESLQSTLRVSVTPDQERYEPGQMASYTIETKDYSGRPVSAEVSLGVLDASATTLTESTAGDFVEAFRGQRQLAVRTAVSLTIHERRERLIEDYADAAVIGEQAPQAVFREVAYWNPAIVTDEGGVARVRFPLPGRVTTWSAMARGITTESLVGSADAEVSTHKPLAVMPNVPDTLYIGDEAVVAALIENYAEEPVQVRVTLATTGGIGAAENPRNLVVGAGERVKVEWEVEAQEAGDTTLTMIAETAQFREIAQSRVSVQPFGERTVVRDAEVVSGEASQTVTVPADARAVSLVVDVAPTLSAALVDSVQHLSDCPESCVEQTVSCFLPALEVSQLSTRWGIDSQRLLPDLPGLVATGLQRLYRLQNRDGGWGWVEGDESRAHHTAYVMLGLSRARSSGYEINERVFDKGLSFLEQSLLETRDLEARAYISYVLAECGEGDLSLARSLSERRRRMDRYAQAYLALALDALGDSASARQIAGDLVEEAVETAHTAHWTEEELDLVAMSSDGRTTAAVLRAVLVADPDNPLVPKAVQWLMWAWQGGHWGTTYETAEIVGALSAYLDVSGELSGGWAYRVLINEELLASETVDTQSFGEYRKLAATSLAPGDNHLRVATEGPGDLYLGTTLQYFGQRETLEPARSLNGPIVSREYEHAESGEPLVRSNVGDLIRVRLRIEFEEDAWYVVVEDPLLPGTETVGFGSGMAWYAAPGGTRTGASGVLQEGRAVFYAAQVGAGVHEYAYLVRATNPGAFRVMPTEVLLMYQPGVWGRSASRRLFVDRLP